LTATVRQPNAHLRHWKTSHSKRYSVPYNKGEKSEIKICTRIYMNNTFNKTAGSDCVLYIKLITRHHNGDYCAPQHTTRTILLGYTPEQLLLTLV
jgi:hypothetical protein